jgi:CheY-like chemotaxis protein/anti-sigma regulatory factor (Ser/Thr protein kinase)
VSGDPARLQQVVWNLLSNAIKFTPRHGQVHITLERVSSQSCLTVRDTGQGISADFLPYVFDRFRQAETGTTRSHGGLGLGLAIVRHLVELHGGEVTVRSPGVDQGATFTVRLPLLAVTAVAGEGSHAPPGASGMPPLDGVRVLVVDDEADARSMLTVILGQRGAAVTSAASVGEALTVLERTQMDVLVSDLAMPGEDGYALIRKVRALGPERGGSVPAIALTAHVAVEDRTRVLIAGYQTHVGKPVEASELVAVVATLAGRTGPGPT